MKLNFNGLFRSSLFLLIASVCFAGLPPTTSQKSGDSSNVTTFNFKFPNFIGSRNGVTTTFSTLSIAGGGTGQGTYNAYEPIYSDGTLFQSVSGGTFGQVLVNQGSGTAAIWQSVAGSTNNVASGLTGTTSFSANSVLIGEGTSPIGTVAVGANFTTLHGNTGAAPSWRGVNLLTDVIGTLPVESGGLANTTFTDGGLIVYNQFLDVFNPVSAGTTGFVLVSSGAGNPPKWLTLGGALVGTLGIANGGTGQASTPTDGQLLIGDSGTSGFTLNTITAGSNITVTNGHHTITIASSGGGGGSTGTVSVSTFTSAGTAAYATPSGCLALEIEQVGGGGGGGGTGTSGQGTAGGAGGDSYFGTSASSHYVYTSGGGGGPVAGNNSFAQCAQCTGGTLSVGAPAQSVASIPGAKGGVAMNAGGNACWMVAHGASTPFSPMPTGALSEDHAGTAGLANSGAGGSGTCDSVGGNDGCGGCAGAYVHYWVDSPSGTYALQVGASGSAGSGGTGTPYAGGAGAAGYLAITCHF